MTREVRRCACGHLDESHRGRRCGMPVLNAEPKGEWAKDGKGNVLSRVSSCRSADYGEPFEIPTFDLRGRKL